MVMAFGTCTHWIRTIPTLIVDDNTPEDVDTAGEDHAYDDWRYGLILRGASYTLHCCIANLFRLEVLFYRTMTFLSTSQISSYV